MQIVKITLEFSGEPMSTQEEEDLKTYIQDNYDPDRIHFHYEDIDDE